MSKTSTSKTYTHKIESFVGGKWYFEAHCTSFAEAKNRANVAQALPWAFRVVELPSKKIVWQSS